MMYQNVVMTTMENCWLPCLMVTTTLQAAPKLPNPIIAEAFASERCVG